MRIMIIIMALFCFTNLPAQNELGTKKTEKIKNNLLDKYKQKNHINPPPLCDEGNIKTFWEYNTLGVMRQMIIIKIETNNEENTTLISTNKGPWRIAWENISVLVILFICGFYLKKDLIISVSSACPKSISGDSFSECEAEQEWRIENAKKEYRNYIILFSILFFLTFLVFLYDLKRAVLLGGILEILCIVTIITVWDNKLFKTCFVALDLAWLLTIGLFHGQWIMLVIGLCLLSIGVYVSIPAYKRLEKEFRESRHYRAVLF